MGTTQLPLSRAIEYVGSRFCKLRDGRFFGNPITARDFVLLHCMDDNGAA